MKRRLKTLGIRQRVLMISLLPMVIFALVLGGYFISTRIDDTQFTMLERGQSISRLLASASEFGLLLGNHELLRNLGKGVSQEPDVADVVFLDNHFDLITRSRAFDLQLKPQGPFVYQDNNHWYFAEPVQVTGISFQDFPEYPDAKDQLDTIGWVIVILSNDPTRNRQRSILITGLLLMLGTFGITCIIALRFGNRITQPIQGLSHVVERLQDGQLDTRAEVSLTGELRTLARGINRMAARIQESSSMMETKVDTTTKRLRATLNHLETKNHELELARFKADTANRAKDEFLARMSHELRTPMTSVLGFARLLDETDANDEQREYTRIINQTSTVLLSIIDDILDLSKLESNAIRLEQIPLDLEDLLLDVLEMQAPLAHNKGLELVLHYAPGIPDILLGDPTRLRQILTNLVANAIKFTEKGEVQLFVAAEDLDSHQCMLRIRVEDSGIGIAENQKGKLFKAFTQADTSITRRFGGSGLGLVITQRLTSLMNGTIKLSSELNEGTQISLTIPFAYSEQDVKPQPGARLERGPILFYEPHPAMRKSLQALLLRLHLNIDTALNFDDFCRRAAQYDCLIWGDSPGMSSEQFSALLQRLRLGYSARLVILCASGFSQPQLDEQTLIVHKPVRTRNLLRALNTTAQGPAGYKSIAQASTTAKTAPSQGLDVLIAEDNDLNRLLITKILSRAGIRSRQATSGLEVLEQVRHKVPDLILMDVHMPRMDGIEATRRLRRTCPELPIIALTANVVPREHQALQNAGITKIMFKPINEPELLAAVKRHCSPAPTRPAPQASADKDSSTLLSYAQIQQEIQRQLEACQQGVLSQDTAKMRHHAHQLLGISGLYDWPEFEALTADFHQCVTAGSGQRELWQSLWRLQRLSKQPLPTADTDSA
ncbi:response regulator [Marinobacterium sedimentorum]|uniref:response regulator n=1 Tax=Marinobacterium sedimentorum TaxID=2927804 RepID=UPI0020C6E77C|nr:response regulator [Marinobacterium sedimentorum]MCP8688742.1 response regulator [Marinobacterium sedimentorum]